MRGRFWFRLGVSCAFGLFLCDPSSHAQSGQKNPVAAVDSLMQRWLHLEQQANTIKSSWREQKPVLEQRLVLLHKERDALTKTLGQSKTSRNEVEQKRLDLVEQQTSLEREQQQVHQTLEAVVTDLQEMSARLPPPLQKAWKDGLPKIQDGSLGDDRRLQVVVHMLTELDDFRRKVSVDQAVVSGSGGRYLVRQAYLGLARGWYVNADGSKAAHGYATPDGWVWRESDDGATIGRLIDIVQARRPAELLSVPVELSVSSSSTGKDASGALSATAGKEKSR